MAQNKKAKIDVELRCEEELDRLEKEVHELLSMNGDDRWKKFSAKRIEKNREEKEMDDFLIEIEFEDFMRLSGDDEVYYFDNGDLSQLKFANFWNF